MKSNQYDLIAPVYRKLKRLVFGDKLLEAEIHFLKNPVDNPSMLVVGCGDAEFLSHIDLSKFDRITCIDKSKNMIEIANKAYQNRNIKVSFVNCDFKEFETNHKYDLISLPFFLDCLTDSEIEISISKCYDLLAQNGNLLITDFYKKDNNAILSNLLLKTMYFFFKLTTNIQRISVPNYTHFLAKDKWEMRDDCYQANTNVVSLKIKKKEP